MLENLSNYQILLASNSPRRLELLSGLGIQFQVTAIPNVDESYPAHLKGEEIPLYVAKAKTEAYRNKMNDNTLLITADTIVWLDNQVYGKPAGADEARKMLKELSGKRHKVITGVSIVSKEKSSSFTATTDVTFASLDNSEIDYYVSLYKPFDKAGAYGIQEWIGYAAVVDIEGSYFNVMGMPVHRLYQELKRF